MSRRSWLLAGLATPLFSAGAAETLDVRYDGDTLRIALPSLHFVSGRLLERLKDGASVAYLAQLSMLQDDRSTPIRKRQGKFVVSYALWEEKFSVTQLGPPAARTAEGLSATAVETWCLDSLDINTVGVGLDQPFWLRFELATADQKDLARMSDKPFVSLWDFVDLLSRKPKAGEPRWPPIERHLRLSELPRSTAGRGRIG